MTRIRIAMLWATGLLASSVAFAGVAPAPSCRSAVDDVAAATGARLDHISYGGRFAVLLHHDINRLSVTCARGDGPVAIEGDLWTAYPRPGFYITLAKAAATLAGQGPVVVEAAMRRCYEIATHDDDEFGYVRGATFLVECHAYLRAEGKLIMVVTPINAAPARFPRAPGPLPGPPIGPVE